MKGILTRSKRLRRLLTALGFTLCVVALERVGAQIFTGATLSLLTPFFATGGGGVTLSGGTQTLIHTIGQGAMVPMSGGSIQLFPGIPPETSTIHNDLGSVHAFPTPFKPSAGHDRITFRGLTSHATIKIFTLSGELVRTLNKNDPASGDLIWTPVANSKGSGLASGVYFYTVHDEDGQGNAKGKLMIIR